MPETLRNAIITVKDEDRNIEYTLSVYYDANGDGAVEDVAVELLRERTWHGKSCTTYMPSRDPDLTDGGLHEICQEIAKAHKEQIEGMIEEHRAARLLNAEEGEE